MEYFQDYYYLCCTLFNYKNTIMNYEQRMREIRREAANKTADEIGTMFSELENCPRKGKARKQQIYDEATRMWVSRLLSALEAGSEENCIDLTSGSTTLGVVYDTPEDMGLSDSEKNHIVRVYELQGDGQIFCKLDRAQAGTDGWIDFDSLSNWNRLVLVNVLGTMYPEEVESSINIIF